MLANRRLIKLNGEEIERTPLLVPSFSSKGFPQLANIIKTTEEVIAGATLVSAYDWHYESNMPSIDFPTLLFLDSGGYEASKDTDLSDLAEKEHKIRPWTQKMHETVLSKWKLKCPTVFISYDHPKERLPISKQIERAARMAPNRKGVIREILIKPETAGQTLLDVNSAIKHIKQLAKFDIIGITEKEIGNSILSRMQNIAQLRLALTNIGAETPIHVFGSLDTITTPLYFLAGADIFDGLTWLRFAYYNGYTVYKHNYGAIELGVKTMAHIIDGGCWFHNYRYLTLLQLEMRRFLPNGDFSCFQYHRKMFQEAYESVAEAVGA